jgi:hypothetical protein
MARVPPNLQFQIDDCEAPWLYSRSRPFDFIKMRAMGGSIADWPALLRQAYEHLCPGGWIELTDFDAWASTDDDSLPETSSYYEYQVRLDEAAKKFGRVMNVGPLHKAHLLEAGFVDIVEDRRKVCLLTQLPPSPANRPLYSTSHPCRDFRQTWLTFCESLRSHSPPGPRTRNKKN